MKISVSISFLLLLYFSFTANSSRVDALWDELERSFTDIEHFVDIEIKNSIQMILLEPNTQVALFDEKILKASMQDIYNLTIDKLDNLSSFFSKLFDFLQLYMYSQVEYKFDPQLRITDHILGYCSDPKVIYVEKSCTWVQRALKIINLARLQRSLCSPEFAGELSFEEIFSGYLTRDGYGLAPECLSEIISKKRYLTGEEKAAFKKYLLFYKSYFINLEKLIMEGLDPDPSDLDGSLMRSQPLAIEGIIHSHRLNE
jgi:hypothetical protein